jgi:hypothetical protein
MEHADEQPSVERVLEAAQKALSERFGGLVALSQAAVLQSSGRSRVLRCRVEGEPSDLPASLILKQALGDAERAYDPEDAPPFSPAWRFFNDWTGAEFLSAVSAPGAPPVCPRFYGGDRAAGFVLLEDLGEGESLADLLQGADPVRAEQALLAFATTLGRMHAATIGREAEYLRRRRALGAPEEAAPEGAAYPRFREGCEAIGFLLSPEVEAEVAAVTAAMRQPGPFRAYTHGDPCPDNTRCADGQLRLLDFEFGAFRHALRDGVYGRILFPTCWCVSRLPPEIAPRMEARYRSELVKGCPEAGDDARFYRAVVEACAHWALETAHWHLPEALKEEGKWGLATPRQRLLVRFDLLAGLTEEFGCREPLGAAARAIAARLRALWPPEADAMPVYPAFRAEEAAASPTACAP